MQFIITATTVTFIINIIYFLNILVPKLYRFTFLCMLKTSLVRIVSLIYELVTWLASSYLSYEYKVP